MMKTIRLLILAIMFASSVLAQQHAISYIKLSPGMSGVGSTQWYSTSATTAVNDSVWTYLLANNTIAGNAVYAATKVTGNSYTDILANNYSYLDKYGPVNADVVWPYKVAGAFTSGTVSSGGVVVPSGGLGTVAIAQGGTGATTQAAAIDALSGTQSSGKYLRSDGTHATLNALKAADISDTVAVALGGTGVKTLTAHGVVLGEGTANVAVSGAGTAGQMLISGGASADPSFTSTISAAVTISATTNQLVLGGASHLLTINSPAIAAATQTYTIPDVAVAASFSMFPAPGLTNAASGAIPIPVTQVTNYVITYNGGAGAYTLAAPTAGTDDGKVLIITTLSAQAHVITSGVDGFNAKGSSGTVTYTAAIGNSVTLVAYNGHWYTVTKTGVAVA